MGTSDSPRLWLTSVTPPNFDSTSGPDLNSVSSVPIVKSTRRRTILEVVIQLKGVRPAYRTASSGSGTSFGDVAEDQAITKGQSRKEGIDRDAEDDKDYDGDVDGDVEMNEDEMHHNHDKYQVNRHQTGLAVASPSNERYQGEERGAAAHSSEITAVHRAESIDLDLDSPSSCVTSSCSSDSEDDDLCSIDDTDLTDDLERSDKLELDGDDGKSDFGRVSHVSCSVDESSDEDEAYQKRLRSSAPSPPVPVIHPIVQPLVNVLETPASPCFKTLDSKIKLEGGESTDVMDRTMSSQAHTPPSLDIIPSLSSSPMSPLPIPMRSALMSPPPISMSSSQQTADAFKARKYARLRLEVSLPHFSLRKRTASAQKGNATRIVVKEGSQACQLGDRNGPLKQGWNDGWPGQWEAGNNVATASNLMITVEGMQSDTLRNGEVSQDVLGRETSLDEEVKDGLVVPMVVDGCRLSLTPHPLPTRPTLSPPSTLPTLPPFQDNRHTYPTANIADAPKPHEHLALAVSTSSSFDIPTSSPLATGSICSAKAVVQADHIASHPNSTIPTSGAWASSSTQTGSSSSARFLALLFDFASNGHPHQEAAVDTVAPNGNKEFGESNDTINLEDSVDNRNGYGRALKRKLGSMMDDDEDEDGESERIFGNELSQASSSAETGYGQPTSRPGYGMRERSLGGERDQIQSEAESMEKDDGATVEVEDVKEVDVKDEDVKMEDETVIKWKGKGKEVAAADSSSIDGCASSPGVKVEETATATRPNLEEEMGLCLGNEEINRYFNVAAISSGTPGGVVVPAVASTTGNVPRDVLPVDKVERRNATAHERREGEASTTRPKVVDPRTANTSLSNRPPQVAPPQSGIAPIDRILARSHYDGRGRRKPEPLRKNQRIRKSPDPVLAYPPRTVVGHLPTLDDIDSIYIYLQLAPLVPSRMRLENDMGGPFFHGNDLWNRVLHPHMKQVLSDQNVVYPAMNINPYPPEAVFIRFQIDQWRTQASVASYKACILGGSESDNQAMKSLLNRSIGGQLPLDYSLSLLQVLASKLDAVGRMGMGDEVSPCRIMSTNCLERGYMDAVTTTAEFDGFLRHCSASPSTGIMAGWFICHGKVSTYSYTFENRSLRVYSTGRVIGPRFHGYVQVLLDSLTNILDLPEYEIDVELLHLAPLAQPPEEGPIAIAILELLLLDKIPHRCLLDMQTTEDRLAAWIPQARLQHAQYLLDDHAAFKLLDTRLQSLRRMMDGCAQ